LWQYIYSKLAEYGAGYLLRATEFDEVFGRMFSRWEDILAEADRLVDELLKGKVVARPPPVVADMGIVKAWGTFEKSVERLLWMGYSPMGAVEEAMKEWPTKTEEEIKGAVAKAMKTVSKATDEEIAGKLNVSIEKIREWVAQ
jgi:hypothetical protein